MNLAFFQTLMNDVRGGDRVLGSFGNGGLGLLIVINRFRGVEKSRRWILG